MNQGLDEIIQIVTTERDRLAGIIIEHNLGLSYEDCKNGKRLSYNDIFKLNRCIDALEGVEYVEGKGEEL